MARKIYILSVFVIAVFFLSGCLAKSTDFERLSKVVSDNADTTKKMADLFDAYQKTEATAKLKAEATEKAIVSFEESQKSKGLSLDNESVTKGVKAVGSITEMCGIPYGGIATDIVLGLLGLFGGKKALDNRNQNMAKRRKEDEDWKKYLASLTPEEANKAIEMNGV